MKKKLKQLENDLTPICDGANTALWFSGGKDSLLLLEVILANGLDCVLLRFDDGWSKEQKRFVDDIIGRRNVAVYSWKPHFGMLFGKDGEITAVSEYGIGRNGASMPILRDIVKGDKCSFDIKFDLRATTNPPVAIKRHLVGSKATDRHYAFGEGGLIKADRFNVGDVEFYAPLLHWTDADVVKALKLLGVEYKPPTDALDTGNIAACTKCLHGTESVLCPKTNEMVEVVQWQPEQNLNDWRRRNSIEVEV